MSLLLFTLVLAFFLILGWMVIAARILQRSEPPSWLPADGCYCDHCERARKGLARSPEVTEITS